MKVQFLLLICLMCSSIVTVNSLNNKNKINNIYDEASYSFSGFEKSESIPVMFPKDICMFSIDGNKYAASLYTTENFSISFVIHSIMNGSYKSILERNTPNAIALDCTALDDKGYVILGLNLNEAPKKATDGSPLFEITSGKAKVVQYFAELNVKSVHLSVNNFGMFLLQSFESSSLLNSKNVNCPYFHWVESSFHMLGNIPCSNAKRLEQFNINGETFIAVANYADKYGRFQINSEIYKYSRNRKKFSIFQKIKTTAATDVKYFEISTKSLTNQHFLVFVNSMELNGTNQSLEANSVIYKYEKGSFIPYQKLLLFAAKQFLPLQAGIDKFILLVSCEDQETKVYELNDWKFEKSSSQLTEGALGKGVSKLRTFELDNEIFLVIANERMLENSTNVYRVVFKQEQYANKLRQNIIDLAEETFKKLSKVDIERLNADLDAFIKSRRITANSTKVTKENVQKTKFKRIVTKSLNYAPKNMTRSFWRLLDYTQEAIAALTKKLEDKKTKFELLENSSVRTSRLASSRGFPEDSTQKIDSMKIDTLIVQNKLIANNINGVKQDNNAINLNKITAPKIILKNKSRVFKKNNVSNSRLEFKTLTTSKLNLSGTFNKMLFEQIFNKALLKTGNQVILAPVKIHNFEAHSIAVSSQLISSQNISKLVLINGGNYTVNQNVQFSKPIYARRVEVSDRINNINVDLGKLDVLLLKSDEPQSITGIKHFENVRLLEPVVIGGKMSGKHLANMIPLTVIDNDITVTGDFTITGNVTIKNSISSSNYLEETQGRSVKEIIQNGLKKTDEIEGLNLKFRQPIHAQNLNSGAINSVNIDQLVKINSTEVQIITGHKTFVSDLHIFGGLCEVNEVNGINVEHLEDIILTKFGQQNITGRLHFNKIITNRVKSTHTTLNGKSIETILTTSTKQHIPEYTVIHNLTADELTAQNLFTSSLIFGTNIDKLCTDIQNNLDEMFDGNERFPGIIYVKNLNIVKSINNQPVANIVKMLTQLEGNFEIFGPVHFKYDSKILNLSFYGNFNGIPSHEFGRAWLLKDTDQEFIAPQTFTSVSFVNNVNLSGTINNIPFDNLISDTYRLDRNEYVLQNVLFENTVALYEGLSTNGNINNVDFQNDMLYRNSDTEQNFYDTLECAQQIYVKGEIKNVEKINNFDLKILEDYLKSKPTKIAFNKVVFENAPLFKTINSHDLNKIRDHIWLKHSDVILDSHVEITNAEFLGPVEILGPVNGISLKYLRNNYFSLSKAQDINTELKFVDMVKFEDSLVGNELEVYGPINDFISNKSIIFREFVKNSFMKDKDQTVTAEWRISNLYVKGNLNNVLINNLNFGNDVVRFDVPINNVTGAKFISSLTVKSLHANSGNLINNLDISDIIHKTVYVNGNYTIQGTTKIDTTVLYNDAIVFGTVNNIKFDESTLFLRDYDQTINGHLRLVTKFPEKQQLLPSIFKNLNAKYINKVQINEFFKSVVDGRKDISIEGQLVFEKPLVTQNFDCNGYLYDYNTKQHFEDLKNNNTANKAELNLKNFESITKEITSFYKDHSYYLNHFEHLQTIKENARKFIGINLETGDRQHDTVIAVLRNNNQLGFYCWNTRTNSFELTEDFAWSQQFENVLDISKLTFKKMEFLFIESIKHNIFNQNVVFGNIEFMTNLIKLESNASQKISSVQINGHDCFILYSYTANFKTPIYCTLHTLVGQDNIVKLAWHQNLNLEYPIQIINVHNSLVAVLYQDFVEIRNLENHHETHQSIPVTNPLQLASVRFKETTFLAVRSLAHQSSQILGSVEIYTSVNNLSFVPLQSIIINSPLQIEFSFLEKSNDLLLHILSGSEEEPILFYKYKGVAGFEKILKITTLPKANALNVINVKSNGRNFVFIAALDEITVVEIDSKT